MPLTSRSTEGENKHPGNNVTGIWSDCIIKIVGWFQISGQLNSATGNYSPEVDSTGAPISGPGWIAYEKPGASPGDIVIIYRLDTILTSGTAPDASQIGSVLWDLINPGGLSYWAHTSGLKSIVSPSDLISQLPHPGGILTPPNPDNPLGNTDILWTKVTTQYELPGPGNQTNPQFIRAILPGFGVRLLVWTDSCCVASNMTMHPHMVPTIPPIVPTIRIPGEGGGPNIQVPTVVVGDPGGGTSDLGGGGAPSNVEPRTFRGVGEAPTQNATINLTPTETDQGAPATANQDPTAISYQSAVSSPNAGFNVPVGTSPPPRPGGNPRQPSYSQVPTNHPLPWIDKIGDYDEHMSSRARPVGTRYLRITEGGVDPRFLPSRIKWNMTADYDTLRELGLLGHIPREGKRAQLGRTPLKTAPSGRSSSRAEPDKADVVTDATGGPSISSDPIVGTGSDGFVNDRQTIGGSPVGTPKKASDVEVLSSPRIVVAGNSQFVRAKNRGQIEARKPMKQTQKGLDSIEASGNPAIASLRRRTIVLSRARQSTQMGNTQHNAYKQSGPGLSDLRRIKTAPKVQNQLDPSGEFEIRPIVFRGGPEWAYITIIVGNVQSVKKVILKQTAYLHTPDGTLSANVGTSGEMEFGRINPPQPGMYVIANPSCIPGQGSLPNLIAGGTTWTLMTLVSTLMTREGAVISQQLLNFLPAGPGDTDVQAPNRLPVGLMRDLDIQSTAEYLYDGTVDKIWPVSADWYIQEPAVVVRRSGPAEESVSAVLKVTTQSQEQSTPFRPLMEMYEDTVLQSSGPLTSFISGPCSGQPGWYDPSTSSGNFTGQYPGGGGIHTACAGMQGFGGAGGTSSYATDQFGQITSGPYNPGVYPGTHQCFLHFNYDPTQAATSDSAQIAASTNYRLRVYNNGPATTLNGYVIYTQGLEIVPPSASLSILSGELQGSVTTYHCNHRLKVVNTRTFEEIERPSSWTDGTITLGSNTPLGTRLTVQSGDTIKVFRPGFDNEYNSQQTVAEFTV